jgi:arabinose-5-phosphate isomerase
VEGSIRALEARIGPAFIQALDHLYACRGRTIVTGMGKSGLVGRKIAATLTSTGTPAFYLHPAEGVHGDAGVALKGDVVSRCRRAVRRGVAQLSACSRFDLPVALVGAPRSTLARRADVV